MESGAGLARILQRHLPSGTHETRVSHLRKTVTPVVVAATSTFNLSGYTDVAATVLEGGLRRIVVETDQSPG